MENVYRTSTCNYKNWKVAVVLLVGVVVRALTYISLNKNDLCRCLVMNFKKSLVIEIIKSMFLGFISTIVDCIFTITGASIGTIIAKIIDRYDKKRRNGYCFNF